LVDRIPDGTSTATCSPVTTGDNKISPHPVSQVEGLVLVATV
jgi:hypothetical protein